jgi:hypothetical protein
MAVADPDTPADDCYRGPIPALAVLPREVLASALEDDKNPKNAHCAVNRSAAPDWPDAAAALAAAAREAGQLADSARSHQTPAVPG